MNIPDQPIAMSHKIHTTPTSGDRFTTTCGSNIPNGSSQMANPPSVILTRRASRNCSTLSRKRDPTSLSLLFIAPSNRGLEGKDLWNMFYCQFSTSCSVWASPT